MENDTSELWSQVDCGSRGCHVMQREKQSLLIISTSTKKKKNCASRWLVTHYRGQYNARNLFIGWRPFVCLSNRTCSLSWVVCVCVHIKQRLFVPYQKNYHRRFENITNINVIRKPERLCNGRVNFGRAKRFATQRKRQSHCFPNSVPWNTVSCFARHREINTNFEIRLRIRNIPRNVTGIFVRQLTILE